LDTHFDTPIGIIEIGKRGAVEGAVAEIFKMYVKFTQNKKPSFFNT